MSSSYGSSPPGGDTDVEEHEDDLDDDVESEEEVSEDSEEAETSGDEWEPEEAAPSKKARAQATPPAGGSAKGKLSAGKQKSRPSVSAPLARPASVGPTDGGSVLRCANEAQMLRSDRHPEYEYAVLNPSKQLRTVAEKASVPIVKKPKGGALSNEPAPAVAHA